MTLAETSILPLAWGRTEKKQRSMYAVRAGERGIGRYVEERRVRDPFRIENIGDLFRESALIQESVSDDARLLLMIALTAEFF